jgi:hypothetical protein
MINGKTVFYTLINGERVYKFATGDKSFFSVYAEDNKPFFRLSGISKTEKGFMFRCKLINPIFCVCIKPKATWAIESY